jgi:hypothetical protein
LFAGYPINRMSAKILPLIEAQMVALGFDPSSPRAP